jgi:hypothetical protein
MKEDLTKTKQEELEELIVLLLKKLQEEDVKVIEID